MSNEDYKEYITDNVNRLNDSKVLRLIYFFIQGITKDLRAEQKRG